MINDYHMEVILQVNKSLWNFFSLEINEVIYQSALQYENVVRLKGGDPLVFGRGGEEGIYLFECDIKFEFIPGITSAIVVPEYADTSNA
jgi:siroheme synthase